MSVSANARAASHSPWWKVLLVMFVPPRITLASPNLKLIFNCSTVMK